MQVIVAFILTYVSVFTEPNCPLKWASKQVLLQTVFHTSVWIKLNSKTDLLYEFVLRFIYIMLSFIASFDCFCYAVPILQ